MNEQKNSPLDIIRPLIYKWSEAHSEQGAEYARHSLDTKAQWEELLDERENKEVEFAGVYAEMFAHGTAGHNRLMLIVKLETLLDVYEEVLHALADYIESGRLPG